MRIGTRLYVVADDEHHLGVIDVYPAPRVRLHRVHGGDLPADAALRKARKPDVEALAHLPPGPAWPHGALLGLGSGSRQQRERAFVALLDAQGGLAGAVTWVDLAVLYEPLRRALGELNIEGAFVAAERLLLLHRANAGAPVNAHVAYALDAFVAWLADAAAAPDPVLRRYELGTADGVPFGFTDATALPDGGWLFSAVAEDTDDSYLDGRCVASAIGRVGPEGDLLELLPLAGAPKVEGLCLAAEGDVWLVTDADDPAVASRWLTARMPRRYSSSRISRGT